MGAGDGAAEQSRKAAERVERLKQKLLRAEHAEQSWKAGAEGERLVAAELARLAPHGWYMLHDVHWPGRPLANLDHVLVGPGGIVVVDTKNWTGNVTAHGGVLRQNGRSRASAIEGALRQGASVAGLLVPEHGTKLWPMICLAGHPDMRLATVNGVAVVGVGGIEAAITRLKPVLDPLTVAGLHAHLAQQLVPGPARQAGRAAEPHLKSAPAASPVPVRQPAPRPSKQSKAFWGLVRAVLIMAAVVTLMPFVITLLSRGR
ncbi:nuclease-related domain-containing protein [Arthrobacter sp. CJ23]|uniref:nuclease-related domain-containing protein n=1 Tax=Arthrobacter sp. CJ23 TaxID=2972479 RepID=UPI00215C940C|nr:nuclease-related domain-containing protein [Arthrobacter sp. CJ23]UVJ39703.1 NERD domain-containing protein [Arthrobacter sp. CJ23]